MNTKTLPTQRLHNIMTQWRHDLHAHPELGFEEKRTAAMVAGLLQDFGLEVHTGIGETGVVGVLKGDEGGPVIGIRADMDALPIEETNSFAHRSTHEGRMHACGHDGHTTMALGAAKCLSEHGRLNGTVVFIFQPNEEHGLGAPAMIRDGLFDRFGVEEVYAMHNIPGMPVGSFETRPGPITASESLFEIEIEARGGHAALPHMGVDAILVGTEIVQSLQTIVSRKLDPGQNGVVSVTEFITDGKRNVLPGRATLRGDARALHPEINATIEGAMRDIVDGVCRAHGVTATVTYNTIFPSAINAPAPTTTAVGAANAVCGAETVDGTVDGACSPRLFSEDFAHMANARPGCFILMGNGTQGSHARPLHSSDYDFNDEVLVVGSSFWIELVEQRFSETA